MPTDGKQKFRLIHTGKTLTIKVIKRCSSRKLGNTNSYLNITSLNITSLNITRDIFRHLRWKQKDERKSRKKSVSTYKKSSTQKKGVFHSLKNYFNKTQKNIAILEKKYATRIILVMSILTIALGVGGISITRT